MKEISFKLPAPKKGEEAIHDFAIDIARRIIANPTAVQNGFRIGRDVRPLTRFEHPFQTLANVSPSLPKYPSKEAEMAFCISAIAGRLHETQNK